MVNGSVPVRLELARLRSVTSPADEHVTPFHVETSLVVFQFVLVPASHDGPEVEAKRSIRTWRLAVVSHADPAKPQWGITKSSTAEASMRD